MQNQQYIKVIKGVVQWRYQVISQNGNVLSVSQRYFSKSNAVRAARRLGEALNLEVRV
jgi:hypothetical protein